MHKDDIIRMARRAGWTGIYSEWSSPTERTSITVPVTIEQIERFAALVAAVEREACANVCDSYDVADDVCSSDTAEGIAIAIRARGQG